MPPTLWYVVSTLTAHRALALRVRAPLAEYALLVQESLHIRHLPPAPPAPYGVHLPVLPFAVSALFSLMRRPPLSTVLRDPSFHISWWIPRDSFFSHLEHTITRPQRARDPRDRRGAF